MATLSVRELSYEPQIATEAGLFRLLGWFGMVYALAFIAPLVVDLVMVYFYKLPGWWTAFNQSKLLVYVPGMQWWTKLCVMHLALQTVLRAVIALFLIAGSIGCLRRNPQTRFWMITYSILEILNLLGAISAMVGTQALYYYNNGVIYNSSYDVIRSGIQQLMMGSTLPLVLLWLMTRPHVRQIFARRGGR